ncbi:MAG: hypothetical protein ACRC80_16100, partial [Waterburya sp.]
GCWLSLVPTLLTLIITITTSIIIRNKQRDRIKFQHTLKLLLIEYHNHPVVVRIALEYLKQSENKDNSALITKKLNKYQ